MNDAVTVILAAIFLVAIPVNLYVWREVRHIAAILPPIAILTLLSRIVGVLAVVAVILGVLSSASVLFLTTGIRVIPVPGTVIGLVVVLLLASLANVLVLRYLRHMRRSA